MWSEVFKFVARVNMFRGVRLVIFIQAVCFEYVF